LEFRPGFDLAGEMGLYNAHFLGLQMDLIAGYLFKL